MSKPVEKRPVKSGETRQRDKEKYLPEEKAVSFPFAQPRKGKINDRSPREYDSEE